MLKLIASVNWVVGVLAVGVAFLYPMYWSTIVVAPLKTKVEETVVELVWGQRVLVGEGRGLAEFRGDPANTALKRLPQMRDDKIAPGFVFEAFSRPGDSSGDGARFLVVRAYPSGQSLRNGTLPPLLYEYELTSSDRFPAERSDVRGRWRQLSNREWGILGLVKF